MDNHAQIPMIQDVRAVLQRLRSGLLEVCADVGIELANTQDAAKRLKLNRNLMWKLSRVVGTDDPFAALNHLPGEQGMSIAIAGFDAAGADGALVSALQATLDDLARVIEKHAGSREDLELILEGLGLFSPEHRAESGREQAFRGMSMLWGVQAMTRLSAAFFAPAASNPAAIDFVHLASLLGFRRLRPDAHWRLFHFQMHNDAGGALPHMNPADEIEPKTQGDLPWIIRQFCSPNMPALEWVSGPDGQDMVLPGGDIGNTSAFDCTFGNIARGLPATKSPQNLYGSCAATLSLPVRTLIFDVFVHERTPGMGPLETLVYGFPHGGMDNPSAQTVRSLLPIKPTLVELPGPPPGVATPLVPWYNRALDLVSARMNWNLNEFTARRIKLEFPPMSSRVVVRWPLAEP